MRKLLLVLIAITLIFTTASCKPSEGKTMISPAPNTADAPQIEPAEEDFVIARIDGVEVMASELSYQITMLMSSYIGYAGEIDWDGYVEGKLAPLFFQEEAFEAIKMYRAVEKLAQAKGIYLTDEEVAAIESDIEAYATENFGSIAELEELLVGDGMTLSLYKYIAYVPELYNKLLAATYLDVDAPLRISSDELFGYFENDFLTSRHISKALYNEDGTYLSEVESAEVYQEMEYVQSLLYAGEDFLTVMQNFSDDANVKESVTYLAESISPSYAEVLTVLDDYEYSEIVMVEDTYCIIQRLPLDTEYYNEIAEDLREERSVQKFGVEIEDEMGRLEVETTDRFDDVSPEAIYNKYS